jgi:hypothetical protein
MIHNSMSSNRDSLSSPSSDSRLSTITSESSDFIRRSAERRDAFHRAHNSLLRDVSQQAESVIEPAALNTVSNLGQEEFLCKKKLEFHAATFNSESPNSRSVSFGSFDVHSITPRSEKCGAIGLCFEKEGHHIVVRSLNPDGAAALQQNNVPIADLALHRCCCCRWPHRSRRFPNSRPVFCKVGITFFSDSDCDAVNGVSVYGRSVDSVREDISGAAGTCVDLTVMSCWCGIVLSFELHD